MSLLPFACLLHHSSDDCIHPITCCVHIYAPTQACCMQFFDAHVGQWWDGGISTITHEVCLKELCCV